MFPCVRTTPRGSAVDPDVKTISTGSVRSNAGIGKLSDGQRLIDFAQFLERDHRHAEILRGKRTRHDRELYAGLRVPRAGQTKRRQSRPSARPPRRRTCIPETRRPIRRNFRPRAAPGRPWRFRARRVRARIAPPCHAVAHRSTAPCDNRAARPRQSRRRGANPPESIRAAIGAPYRPEFPSFALALRTHLQVFGALEGLRLSSP